MTDTPKLRLPIEVGKTYRRRDGKTVMARKPAPRYDDTTALVSVPGDVFDVMGEVHVWISSGLINGTGVAGGEIEKDPRDLIEGPLDEVPSPKPAPQGHPHAELMAQYAEDARTHPEPWLLWQSATASIADKVWHELRDHPSWSSLDAYRRRPEPPRTININGHKVPEPLREAPKEGAKVWTPDLHGDEGADDVEWGLDEECRLWLERGLLFATREGATQAAKALLSFTAREAS